MKRWIIISAVAATVLLVGVISLAMLRGGQQVQSASVQRGPIQAFVDEQGKTRLPNVHRITMPISGRVAEITAKEGQVVQQGEQVAQMVQKDLDMSIAETKAAVARYRSAIEENADNSVEDRGREQADEMVDSMVLTAQAARVRLESSKKRLEFAADVRKDLQRLRKQRATSEIDLERAQVDEVDRQVQLDQDTLIWLSTESMLKATQLMPKIIDAYVERKEKTGLVLTNQMAEAQARLDQMLIQKQRGTMTSPIEGTVLSRPITNEQFLPAGTVLMTIGNLNQLEIETDVLSQDVGAVRKGAIVQIYGPTVGTQEGVAGVVRRVYPAGFTKISSLGVEQQRVRVIIGFGDGVLQQLREQRHMGVDFRVRVRIITASKQDALVVPGSALFRDEQGKWQVFVIRGRRARQQTVSVGLVNDRFAEITEGLEEEDQVVVAPESNLRDGTRVVAD